MFSFLRSHFVEADSVHADSDGVPGEHLLGRDLVGHGPEVHTRVLVYARQDEEQARARGSALLQPAQSEDDRSLVLLHHLHAVAEGEGQGDEDQDDGEEGEDHGAES